MCRSQAQGGRRCTSHRRGVPTGSSGNTSPEMAQAIREVKALEEQDRQAARRADVDRMARELPADRKGWDGSPLSEKDRRFYALRESGYTGPIDQDGYPDTTSEAAGTLRYMAEKRGEKVDW
jgi:hypothetical protein